MSANCTRERSGINGEVVRFKRTDLKIIFPNALGQDSRQFGGETHTIALSNLYEHAAHLLHAS